MFLLFGIFVAAVAAVLFLVLTSSVLVPISVAIPRVLRKSMQVFWTFKRWVIWLKRSFRVRKELFICSNIHYSFWKIITKKKFWISRYIFSQCVVLMSRQYAIWSRLFCIQGQGQYSLDWVDLVNLCNHEPLCLNFYLGWQYLNFCYSLSLAMR